MQRNYNAQKAHRTSYGFSVRIFGLLAITLLFTSLSLRAQWPTSSAILETGYEVGDTITLIIYVGTAQEPVVSESSLSLTIPYDNEILDPLGVEILDVDNSFFMGSGIGYNYDLDTDDEEGEIYLDVQLSDPYTGSGYGELLRVKGLMVVEDYLKKPVATIPAEKGMLVYPNPSGRYLSVELPADHLGMARVYDLQGRLQLERELPVHLRTTTIDLGDLPAGQYQLHIPGRNATHHQAILVH